MNFQIDTAAEIAIRTLGEEDRRKVQALIEHLKRWDQDSTIRSLAHKLDLPGADDVYVLTTTTDLVIFFTVNDGTLEITDIARRASLDKVRRAS